MNDSHRPYVSAALLCEKILQESNGSLSVIRIADRVEVETNIPFDQKPAIQMNALISIKSGPLIGDFTLKIVALNPKGESKGIFSTPVKLLGNDQGNNLILNLALGVEHEGLHWFDVFLDDELLSRIPLMVVRKQLQIPEATK